MSAEAPAGLAAIGGTPVVRLGRLVTPAMAEVWVKLEGGNPTGSHKDRMALAMIEGAERAGRLRIGQTVVEYTGGSTGASLAFVCALKGYPLRIVTAAAVAPEKIAVMRAFGAQVEILRDSERLTADLMPRLMARAREIVDETGAYATDQFRNPDMVAGYRALGQELARQLEGRLDVLCLAVGTGGCLLGTSRALRESIPNARRVAIQPTESPLLSGGQPGRRDGPPGGPPGGHLLGPVDRRKPGRRPATRGPARPDWSRCDDPGGQRTQVSLGRRVPRSVVAGSGGRAGAGVGTK